MRLIDADAFEKVIRNKLPLGLFMKRTIPSAMKTMGELVEELEKVPTVDLWHYPSKGEYPTEGEQVFVAWTLEGSYDVVKFRGGTWSMKLSPPYAWQYILPPKEEA